VSLKTNTPIMIIAPPLCRDPDQSMSSTTTQSTLI